VNRIRVWLYRGWCWVCYDQPTTIAWPCAGNSGYDTLGEAADAGRQHLRERHGIPASEARWAAARAGTEDDHG
jgi:hypothetical protein